MKAASARFVLVSLILILAATSATQAAGPIPAYFPKGPAWYGVHVPPSHGAGKGGACARRDSNTAECNDPFVTKRPGLWEEFLRRISAAGVPLLIIVYTLGILTGLLLWVAAFAIAQRVHSRPVPTSTLADETDADETAHEPEPKTRDVPEPPPEPERKSEPRAAAPNPAPTAAAVTHEILENGPPPPVTVLQLFSDWVNSAEPENPPEPEPEPKQPAMFDNARADLLARAIAKSLHLESADTANLATAVRGAGCGPDAAFALFDGLAKQRDRIGGTGRWTLAEGDLDAFLAFCFPHQTARLIAPRRGERYDPQEMDDCSRSFTTSRSTVDKLLAPGFQTATERVKALIESN